MSGDPFPGWRSEEMQLIQLLIPAELSHDTIDALGEIGQLQFKDLNADKSVFQRTYASQVKRTDEMARRMRFFTDQVKKEDLVVGSRLSGEQDLNFDELEVRLEELEGELVELNGNSERLGKSHAELLELQLVLERASQFFDDAQYSASSAQHSRDEAFGGDGGVDAPLLASEPISEPKSVRLGFVAGTIATEKVLAFERLLFRATRGNMYLKHSAVGAVADPITGEKQEKEVFIVFFAGERARTKILKICEAYGANRYPFPEDAGRRREMSAEVNGRLQELHSTMDAGQRQREVVLQNIAVNLEAWTVQVKHEKAVYHTLNKLSVDVTRKVLVAEAWAPARERSRIQDALHSVADHSNSSVGVMFTPLVTYETPPTYFATDKVSYGFQCIVDAYGVARYREVNPTIFTIMTFPFLFAVMFGDVGHGVLMLLLCLYLVINEKKMAKADLGDMVDMIFGGRYVILFMAIFSLYTGLIYNEAFSIPLSVFGGTRYACPSDPSLPLIDVRTNEHLCPEATTTGLALQGGPYPFGVDPIWHGSKSELPYLNSLKMKMSIVIGVTHMNLGILMSYFNQRYFRDTLSMVCEFIPQMIFLNALFGYLAFLIILKWVTGSTADLYHIMIYMFLSPFDSDCGGKCPENVLFTGQGLLQPLLLMVALCAVPAMLFPKPYILKKRHEERHNHGGVTYGRLEEESDTEAGGGASGDGGHDGGGDHGDHFDFGEIAVHQMIHTIEFVLGAVSNTASYLRLWALSLAHSQLSAVFYDRVLVAGIQQAVAGQTWALFIAFFVFALATLSVLMVMESLSAFLHAMRLHWVEFQNKFFRGDGYAFAPFSFQILDAEEL
mmetsp:Transcript_11003/g.32964  ORF Transcript_11003/g.32964 Transcript_11003/m.32964 type:complete len:841 (-) Transcript_11003:131-2653(-)|eukprot:CAMPEP_0206149640 /NCGR_PEP_ID=MMETSP1473-20131121/37891_1 /ASSEMBLY_ACC=CAM_ASM_001109 /TAXON_ID=1461547 /ORGANISM="Stichococcus sp, Strain RCC1054" /LENGTH=840 /DNA_ID=CAMNT_0053547119 /DNA_START=96 /DNA_END=2618 /DNA_ORIENTATION=-